MALISARGGSDSNGYVYRWSVVYDDAARTVTAEASLLDSSAQPIRGGFTGVDVTLTNGQTRSFDFQADPTDILNQGPTVYTNVNVRTSNGGGSHGGGSGLIVQERYTPPS